MSDSKRNYFLLKISCTFVTLNIKYIYKVIKYIYIYIEYKIYKCVILYLYFYSIQCMYIYIFLCFLNLPKVNINDCGMCGISLWDCLN